MFGTQCWGNGGGGGGGGGQQRQFALGPQFKGDPQAMLNSFKQDLVHHSHPSPASLRGSFHCIVDFKSACFFCFVFMLLTQF